MSPLAAAAHDRGMLAGYRPGRGTFDELLGSGSRVRDHWARVATALDGMGADELERRRQQVARLLRNDGVTYNIYGSDGDMGGAWPLDPVPLIIPSDDWSTLEEGIAERAEILNLVLADLYGPRDLIRRGLLPPELVFGHRGYLRACDGIAAPGRAGHPLFIYAADVTRDANGDMRVLADFAQAPSGAGFALENRTVISRVFPSLYRDTGVHRLAPFFRALRSALTAAAPAGIDDPRVVVLTPGTRNETYFEHAHLATTLGYALVEGSDLTVRGGRVLMRSLGGLEPVDVILRRIDGWYSDPVELKADSRLGVPGLLEACRRGTVAVVNPVGSSAIENPGLLPYLPAIALHFLGRTLRLPSVDTWWCGDPAARAHVVARLDQLIIKPTARAHGRTAIVGAELSASALDDLRREIEARPYAFVGQAVADTATVPTFSTHGLEARHALLRTFAVATEGSFTVMPGGLTRVAPTADSWLVSNQAGALSKDTWVLSSEPEPPTGFWLQAGPGVTAADPAGSMSSRAAENLFWMGRYAERAEASARLLRAALDRRNDFQHSQNPAGTRCLHDLLRAVTHVTGTYPGFVHEDDVETGTSAIVVSDDQLASPEPEVLRLMLDDDVPGTIAHSLRSLLQATHAVRDQLSADTWMVLGAIERELDPLRTPMADRQVAVQAALAGVLRGLLALSGLGAENMVRDPGWSFLDAGRRLERSLALVALLRATVIEVGGVTAESLMLESVLISTESIITYRRRYRSQAQLETMLDLLLLDADNPRSLSFQVDQLEQEVTALPRPPSNRLSDEERLALDLATRVRLADTVELARPAGSPARREALDEYLTDIADRLGELAAQVELAHFVHMAPQQVLTFGPGQL